jgi:hypothetical protein
MFDLEKAVTEWRRHMIAGGLTNSDTLDELESHLRDDLNRRIKSGVAPRDAFESAVQEIGLAHHLQAEFANATGPATLLRQKLKVAFLFLIAAAFPGAFAWVICHHFPQWNAIDRCLSLGGLGAMVLFMCAGLIAHRYLPFSPNARERARAQIKISVGAFLWIAAVAYLILPHIQPTMDQLIILVIWSFAPIGMFSGFILGLDETVAQLISLPAFACLNADARHSLDLAREEAIAFRHDFIGTEHVLLGLLSNGEGQVVEITRRLGLSHAAIHVAVEKLVGPGSSADPLPTTRYTPRVQRAFRLAMREARALKRAEIGPELLFLGLILEGSGVAARVLKDLRINTESARHEIIRQLTR